MVEMTAQPEDIQSLRLLELHYFRVPRRHWELMLTRLSQLGGESVSTMLPWFWHEPQDRVYDLTGISHPTRGVIDFLEICQAMGFRVALRVSPYLGAGLLGGGVPSWLTQGHPEMGALDPDLQPRRDAVGGGPIPCAEHPTYLKYVERWYKEMTGHLASLAWPDGPIVALLMDPPGLGEPTSPAEGFPASWDYNPHVVEVQWPVWLRQQYEGIEALNVAWESDHRTFSDVPFPSHVPGTELSRQVEDAARFVAYAHTRAAQTYTRLLREAGWALPILTDSGSGERAQGTELRHIVQVAPDPPQIGQGARWAIDAPLRPDGSPRRRFWAVKAALLEMEDGVKFAEGGSLVSRAESGRVRLPRPSGDYAVCRLLLDGTLLDASGRGRGDTLFLDYVAEDEAGETDMLLILEDPDAPLSGYLGQYLAFLLTGRALTLRWGATMCQALAEALSGTPPPAAGAEAPPSREDLQAVQLSLAEAQRAARRAAVSLGRLERLAAEARGELPPAPPPLPEPLAFPPGELERLSSLRQACAQVTPLLRESALSLVAACQSDGGGGAGLTLSTYRATLEGAQAAASEAESVLSRALARLRADLAAGVVSSLAWSLQDWLTRTLQGLTTGWL